jgi:antitoxin YefM
VEILSFTEARNNLKEVFERVYFDNEEVIIHRKGRESVVVISLDEYNSMKETEYLLKSPKNREVLLRSLNDARKGRVFEKELIEK